MKDDSVVLGGTHCAFKEAGVSCSGAVVQGDHGHPEGRLIQGININRNIIPKRNSKLKLVWNAFVILKQNLLLLSNCQRDRSSSLKVLNASFFCFYYILTP
jgi:hypothetical protein